MIRSGASGEEKSESCAPSIATDRFPLAIQGVMIESCLFNKLTSFAWVACGLGTNCFSCPLVHPLRFLGLYVLQLDNPWGFCLLGLSSHYAIILLYGIVWIKYTLIGYSVSMLSSVTISSLRVADVYQSVINALGVKISLPKSLISGCEFAKRIRICDRDLICRPLV